VCNSRVGHHGFPALTQAVETALLTLVMAVQVEASGTNFARQALLMTSCLVSRVNGV